MSLRNVPAKCPCYMSLRNVPVNCPCKMSPLHVPEKCPSELSLRNVPVQCPCKMSLLHVPEKCPCEISLRNVPTAVYCRRRNKVPSAENPELPNVLSSKLQIQNVRMQPYLLDLLAGMMPLKNLPSQVIQLHFPLFSSVTQWRVSCE